MSTLYDLLFGSRASGDGDGVNDEDFDPRVDNSLWKLVVDSKAPAWSGDIGGFIPPGAELGLPGYYGEAAGKRCTPASVPANTNNRAEPGDTDSADPRPGASALVRGARDGQVWAG
ncbi:MAG: hypothetical protein P4N59_25570 [Negativicutes bacterium]|nr:hypothetical protein [Negativicutes bacterium]